MKMKKKKKHISPVSCKARKGTHTHAHTGGIDRSPVNGAKRPEVCPSRSTSLSLIRNAIHTHTHALLMRFAVCSFIARAAAATARHRSSRTASRFSLFPLFFSPFSSGLHACVPISGLIGIARCARTRQWFLFGASRSCAPRAQALLIECACRRGVVLVVDLPSDWVRFLQPVSRYKFCVENSYSYVSLGYSLMSVLGLGVSLSCGGYVQAIEKLS